MNKLEFRVESIGIHFSIECTDTGYYFFYDPDEDVFYDKSLRNIEFNSTLTEEELFQAELVNDTGISVYAIAELHKNLVNNIYDRNCVITIEY